MSGKLATFHDFRSRMNEKLLAKGNLQLKRFFNLDSQVYTDGALPSRTKELMGLVASAVLRCDDCITYHMIRCAEEGVTDEEFFETFNVILVVGGSITIPHIRRAVETLEEIRETTNSEAVKGENGRQEKEDKGKSGKGKRTKKKMSKITIIVVASFFTSLLGMASSPSSVAAENPVAPTVAPAEPTTPLVSTSDSQSQVMLTIYNSNLGLVKDVRDVELSAGERELHFMDVAAEIIPTTVHVKSLTDAQGLSILEQNYEYDLISPEKLLEKYVGKVVKILDKNYYTGQEQLVEATLLSTKGSPVYQVDNEIHVGLPGRVILPQLPDNLLSKPTLVWLLRAGKAAQHKIEASYLTNHITWETDYIVVLNVDDAKADLSGWVSIDNKSGATYKNALLKLVAGDVHRVQPKVAYERTMAMADAVAAPAEPQFKEEGFFEYHLYTLDRPATVKSNQIKQMTLLSAANIPVVKRLILQGQPTYFTSDFSPNDELPPQKVSVTLEIDNVQKNNLGMPLPKGTVRVYKADKEGSLQFVGEDSIDHTAKDETVRVKMGEAFDVTGRRKQKDFKIIARGVTEASWEITVKNHKQEPVTVRVNEPMPGDWEVLSSSQKYEKADAHTLRFDVPVPKDGEVILTYKVRVKMQ